MLDTLPDKSLQQKFIHACLARNLLSRGMLLDVTEIDSEIDVWLINEMTALPFGVSPIFSDEYLFHIAVARGRDDVIAAFFTKYPSTNFHVPGISNRYPIELAASSNNRALFDWFLALPGVPRPATTDWILQMYGRAITKHCDAYESAFLRDYLLELGHDPRPDLLEKLCAALDFRSLEILFRSEKVGAGAPWSHTTINHPPAHGRALHDIFFNSDMFSFVSRLGNPWSSGKTGSSLLDSLSPTWREAGNMGNVFERKCQLIAQENGMIGVVMEKTIEVGRVLHFIRPVMIGDVADTYVMDQQLARFIGYWLPATQPWTRYLNDDLKPSDEGGYSQVTRIKLTSMILAQLTDMHDSSQRLESAWARQLIDGLPGLYLGCILSETERLDAEMLQHRLLERGVFVQNAKRIVHLVQLAHEAILRQRSLRPERFSLSFAASYSQLTGTLTEEIKKRWRGMEDDYITQRTTVDVLNRLSEPDYVAGHYPEGMTGEFAAFAGDLCPEMLWWQIAVLKEALGVPVEKAEEFFQKTHGRFVEFRDKFEARTEFHPPFRPVKFAS